MAEEQDIPQIDVQEPEPGPGDQQQPPDKVGQYYDYLKKAGADVAPTLESFKKTLANDSTARQYYGYLREKHFDAPPDYGSFARTLGVATVPGPPEHEISHTPVQDIRHLNDLANQPVRGTTLVTGAYYDPNAKMGKEEDLARNKSYQDRYEKSITDLAGTWGTDPKATKQAIQDFPDEPDENKLKGFATLNKDNPVYYSRLKSANDIRTTIARSGPDGINDANIFNHLQTAQDYGQLQDNIALQQEIMRKHNLGQAYFEKLKESQAPLINTLDPGLLTQYWNSDDKKLGLSDFQYAGLETEKMFNPGKYKQDVAIIRSNRGLDENGQGEPAPQSKKGYAYDRGVENVLYALENQGRQNTGRFVSQRTAELGPQIDDALSKYKQLIASTTDPLLQQHFQQEFLKDPLLQEAAKIDEGQQSIEYAQSEDQRRFPLNYGDQASRLVKDAMGSTNGWAGVAGKQVLLGAGESADNTMRFIKNTYINLLGSDHAKAENAAVNIGKLSLQDLAGYEGNTFSMQQAPLIIGDGLVKKIQGVFNDQALSTDQKNQQATELVMNNEGEIKANPKAGQQNLTGKAVIYSAANTIGQIIGIADQSLLMGGLLGDASKAQQMANAFVPMYASTQNQLYEQALAEGKEKPLLSSHLDAAIMSLASLINPDIKVVKGMVGAETGIGKLIAGVDESAWNKVLSSNKSLVDRMVVGTKATARQLGLANLQYGLIVPTAQYIVHKNVLNEDPNLGDAIKDGLLQTNISMALPALLHGVWGGVNATRVNPTQKYALVEAGLHPKENIELIDHMVEIGQVTPDRADQLRDVIRQTGQILEHTEAVKSDGTWMNEHEVADLTYQMLRKKVLEVKLKNAPDPQKAAIEEKIHEINQSVADLHTSEEQKHKTELNQLLTDNLDRIREKMQPMETAVKDAIKRNEPEQVFKEIYDQATETKNVDGKEVSSRGLTEEIFGKALVEKAFELHKEKPSPNASPAETADQGQVMPEKPQEGAAPETTPGSEPAASSLSTSPNPEQNAIPESSSEGQVSSVGTTGEDIPLGSEGVGPGQQGEEPAGQSGRIGEGQEPPVRADGTPVAAGEEGDRLVGPSHDAMTALALRLGLKEPERGTALSPAEYAARGRIMIAGGADPEKVAKTFKRTGNVSPDIISVSRAHLENLEDAADKAGDRYGMDSAEYKAALEAVERWQNDVLKPMGNMAGQTFTSLQGVKEMNTGSFTSLTRAFIEMHKQQLTEKQAAKIKELSSNVKTLEKQVGELTEKISEAHQKQSAPKADRKVAPEIKKKANDLAQKLRDNAKLNRPGMFSAATPASLVWDGAVEVVAKAIQLGGLVGDAIAKGVDHIRESEWYKGLSDPDKEKAEDQFTNWHLEQTDKKTAARIKALEKQLSDLQEGKVKSKGADREESAREKELKDEIFDAKQKLGLNKPRSTPQPKGEIPEQTLAEKVLNKTGNVFSPEEAKAIWAHVKENYIDKGIQLGDALRGTSTDLGLTADQILHAIEMPKGVKELTLEMWQKQYDRNKAMNFAKRYVQTADQSAPKKFFNRLPSIFFNLKTYGHGTVGNITHAGPNIFRPSVWKAYWPNVIKSFALAYGKEANYEKAVSMLKSSKNFDEWLKAGLAADPNKAYDEYQVFGKPRKKTAVGRGLQWLGEAGTRGFSGLNFMRYDMAEMFYNKASDAERADPELRSHIAELVNHATGHTEVKPVVQIKGKIYNPLGVLAFAPGLEISRWQRMITDPAAALNTFAKWSKKTPAEQAAAKIVARGAGEKLAMYSALLAANAGLLAATGSNQSINTTDPTKSDWLRFKFAGKTLDVTGNILSPMRLLSGLVGQAYLSMTGSKKDMRTKPGDKDAQTLGQQARFKLSPLAGELADVATGTDAMGNTEPWSNVPPGKWRHKMDWYEWVSQQAPIPIAAGIKATMESMEERGMTKPQVNDLLNGLLLFGVEGFTGAKMTPDYSTEEKKQTGRTGRTGGHTQ